MQTPVTCPVLRTLRDERVAVIVPSANDVRFLAHGLTIPRAVSIFKLIGLIDLSPCRMLEFVLLAKPCPNQFTGVAKQCERKPSFIVDALRCYELLQAADDGYRSAVAEKSEFEEREESLAAEGEIGCNPY